MSYVVDVLCQRVPESLDEEVTLGGPIAGDAFLQALLRHGSAARIALYTPAAQVHAVRAWIERDRLDRGGRVAVTDWGASALRHDSAPGDVLHDPDDSVRAFQLRQLRRAKAFPITWTNHCASYASFLHSTFLKLLLADTEPHDCVICPSESSMRAFTRLLEHVRAALNDVRGGLPGLQYPGRVAVVPHGVDTERFSPCQDKRGAKLAAGLPPDRPVLLWLGRQSAVDKADLMPLLRTMRQMLDGAPADRPFLVLAGSYRKGSCLSDGYEAEVRRGVEALRLEGDVCIMPHVKPSHRHQVFAFADVFVSPADNVQETFGLTLLEAMASGVPQVVSDWDGYRETVRHGSTGVLIPTYWARADSDLNLLAQLQGWEITHLSLGQSVVVDPLELRRALELLSCNRAERERMARESRERAVTCFDWSVIIRRYEELWSELSRMAAAAPPPAPSREPRYDRPIFAEAFGHYATKMLDEGSRLAITPAGEASQQASAILPAYHARTEILREDIAMAALSALRGGSATLGVLEQELSAVRGEPPALVRRHLLWLLKHGLARLM